MNLRQKISAYGARWSQSGRLLLEHLAKLEAKDADYWDTAKELVDADDLILKNWLCDSRVRPDWLLEEPCTGDCDGECGECRERAITKAEFEYDASREAAE